MKAAIVTFVRAYNYGAVLQCYALSEAMKAVGIETEVLDYYPEYFKNMYNLSYLGEPRFLPYRPIKNWLKFSYLWLLLKKKNEGFERFLSKYIPLTRNQYATMEELNNAEFEYDAFVCGSDQVWSVICTKFDPVFFLNFNGAKYAKKLSYAASFGFTEIPEGKEEDYKERLSGWDSYCVREKSGIDIINKLLGENAIQCCDPTLLLKCEDWDKVKISKNKRKPYILAYCVNGTHKLYDYAKQLSNEKKMKVKFLNCLPRHEFILGEKAKKYGFENIATASPDEWIGYFDGAEYVITDSFHGTVFSIIYNKKFKTLSELNNGKKNNRALELISSLGLEQRILVDTIADIDDSIDWTQVEAKLEKIRQHSIDYLSSLITKE